MKILLGLLALLVCTQAHADYVVVTPYISGADVTISALNNNQNSIVNTLNGNVEGGINIKPGSINSGDLAQAVSPVVRWGEAFNSFTYSGMLPATSGSLTSDISSGVSYVNGYRINNSATAHTYSASKDTFVYINQGGYYQYCEEPNGTSSCGVPPTQALLLAEVVTSGSAITSVNDLRQLSIQITTTTTNFPANYRDAAFMSRDSSVTMHGEPGGMAIGTTIYTRTTDTSTKNVTLGTNWIEGGYAPGSPTTIFMYAYNDAGSSWDFKYSSADPVASDTLGNSNGILRYYSDGGTVYRSIGWAYLSADQMSLPNFSDFTDVGVPNKAIATAATDVTSTATAFTDAGAFVPDMRVNFYSTGRRVKVEYNAPHFKNGNGIEFQLQINGTAVRTFTFIAADNNIAPINILWEGILTAGTNTVALKWRNQTSTGTIYQRGATDGQRTLVVEEL